MAKIKVEIVEGWTGALDFELLSDGTPQNLTSLGVSGRALERDKRDVTLTSDVSVVTATEGLVRLTPDTSDFYASGSPYERRFMATEPHRACVPGGPFIALTIP